MNYRHAFHAGNFADVLKHAVLARILTHLGEKAAAFRVIDTHAGAGLYDLGAAPATRTGEWRDGIGRLIDATLPDDIRALLAPYLAAVAAANPGGGLAPLSGLAADRARPDAAAGPAGRLRARARRRRGARRATAARHPRPRGRRSTAGRRSTPMCRRRSGAASC